MKPHLVSTLPHPFARHLLAAGFLSATAHCANPVDIEPSEIFLARLPTDGDDAGTSSSPDGDEDSASDAGPSMDPAPSSPTEPRDDPGAEAVDAGDSTGAISDAGGPADPAPDAGT